MGEHGKMLLVGCSMRKLELNPNFTAYDLNFNNESPWPFMSRYHHIRAADGPDAHDHPFEMQCTIITGGYQEEIFCLRNGEWTSSYTLRLPGDSFYIPAYRVHRINELLEDECWTHVVTARFEQEWRVYPEKEIRNDR